MPGVSGGELMDDGAVLAERLVELIVVLHFLERIATF